MEGASVDNPQEASEKRRTGGASSWRLPRLILIGDGFTDSECADRIVDAAANSSGGRRGAQDRRDPQGVQGQERALWVHLRDRAAPEALFEECAARLTKRLRKAAPSILLSVNGRPEVADALQCGYHAGVRDAAPGFSHGPRQPYGRSAHNPEEARAAIEGNLPNRCLDSAAGTNPRALGINARTLGTNPGALGTNPRALGTNPRTLGNHPRTLGINPRVIGNTPRESEVHCPQYLFFSPVFNPQGKPGYAGAGVGALRDFVQYVQGRVPVYALGGVTPERVGPCLDAGSYGVAVLSGIMMADRPGEAAHKYFDALRAYFEEDS